MDDEVIFSPKALRDLEEIGDFIAMHSPSRARSFAKELEAQCHKIAQSPFMYVAREDVATGLHMCTCGRYLIWYRADDVEVRIVRIAEGARDQFSLF